MYGFHVHVHEIIYIWIVYDSKMFHVMAIWVRTINSDNRPKIILHRLADFPIRVMQEQLETVIWQNGTAVRQQ